MAATTYTAGQVLTAAQMEALPKGRIAESTLTTDVSTVTTVTDVTTVTFTGEAGRYYRLVGYIPSVFQTTGGNTTVTITSNANTVLQQTFIAGRANNSNTEHHIWTIVQPGSGSVTYKLRIAANNAVTVDNSSTQVTRFYVEDIGN